jgi:hypothetical protein
MRPLKRYRWEENTKKYLRGVIRNVMLEYHVVSSGNTVRAKLTQPYIQKDKRKVSSTK